MEIPELSKEEGLIFLDSYLKDKSYVRGFHPSKADVCIWDKLRKCPSEQHCNAYRWYTHLASFSSAERSAFPPSDIEIKFAQTEPVNTEVNGFTSIFIYPIPLYHLTIVVVRTSLRCLVDLSIFALFGFLFVDCFQF